MANKLLRNLLEVINISQNFFASETLGWDLSLMHISPQIWNRNHILLKKRVNNWIILAQDITLIMFWKGTIKIPKHTKHRRMAFHVSQNSTMRSTRPIKQSIKIGAACNFCCSFWLCNTMLRWCNSGSSRPWRKVLASYFMAPEKTRIQSFSTFTQSIWNVTGPTILLLGSKLAPWLSFCMGDSNWPSIQVLHQWRLICELESNVRVNNKGGNSQKVSAQSASPWHTQANFILDCVTKFHNHHGIKDVNP